MKHLLLTVLLLGMFIPLAGQSRVSTNLEEFNPQFELLTLPGGQAGNGVQKIIQDSIGYLWFATQAGLFRYDGQHITTYNHDPNNPNSLPGDYIEDIIVDPEGILWMTHWDGGGLTSMNPDLEIFTRYGHDPDDPESLLSGGTSALVVDREGYIWIGGREGLSRLNRETGKFKHFQHDPEDASSLSDNEVRSLYVDLQGTLWVGTGMPWIDIEANRNRGGLNRYDPETETFTRFMHDPDDSTSLVSNKVKALFEDSKGNFWVGTAGDGLHLMDRDRGIFKRLTYKNTITGGPTRPYLNGSNPDQIPDFSHITSIYEDDEGRLWITAVAGGMDVFNPETGEKLHVEMGQPAAVRTNFFWQVMQSRDGTIWICTGGEGAQVFKVRTKDFKIPFYEFGVISKDSIGEPHGILEDRNGNIWFAQSAENRPWKLWQIDRTKNTAQEVNFGRSSMTPGFLNTFLSSLSVDLSGNIWVGTGEGYFVGNPDTGIFQRFSPKNLPSELTERGIPPIIQSKTGEIWLPGWEVGLTRYDPKTGEYRNYRHDENNPQSIRGDLIWGMFEDNQGNLWVGGGTPWYDPGKPLFLDRFNKQTQTFDHFLTLKEEIKVGMITAITDDRNGKIWFIDFQGGLYRLDPGSGEVKKFTAYNSILPREDLLSMTKDQDEHLWITTAHYIVEVDPILESMTLYSEFLGVQFAGWSVSGSSMTSSGELLFARKGGFHAFYPESLSSQLSGHQPDLRITGFRLLDEPIATGSSLHRGGILEKPIWKTTNLGLEYNENVFSFSVACFDFYYPEANQIQFMLEGYDRGWRQDIRNGETPSYINIPPGNYTFRLRGANGMGVWDREGIRLNIKILPPWWKSLWAYAMYGMVFIGGVFAVDRVQRKRIKNKERSLAKEKELEQAREIEKAYKELKETQSQLIQSEKMASLGELTAGIAHEIQNPLNFVNNFSDVNKELLEEMKEEIKKGNLKEVEDLASDVISNEEKISHHGRRAESIVKNMLQHSRTGTGEKESIDFNAMLHEYTNLAFHGMRARDKSFNADFSMELDERLPEAKVIPQDMGRVILNLINNAFYAAHNKSITASDDFKPSVMVSSKQLDGRIEISVKDNGDGIPAEIKDKIFQPFFTTKPTGSGTGLGLSLSYDIIKAHGGEIKVESTDGKGTEFIIQIPVE